jgi:hypothetical protein
MLINDQKRLAACHRMLIGETHHCTFQCCSLHAQARISADQPNDVRHRCAGNCRHHLCDAVQAVVAMKVQLRVAHRYTHTVHLRRDADRMGHEVTRRLRVDMRRVKMRALEALQVTVGCKGIVTLPNTAHELGITTKPARIFTYGGSHGDQ